MSLVTLATQVHKRAFRAWDAMHVVIAARWAYDLNAKVELLTADGDFDAALEITLFGGRLSIRNLDVQASTGDGFDRRNR